MALVPQRCAGIDIVQRQTIVACLHVRAGTESQSEERTFGTDPGELAALIEWLAAETCTHVALKSDMAAEPLLLDLQRHFEVILAGEQAVRDASGRHVGATDAACLADLLATGMIGSNVAAPAPVPPSSFVRRLRDRAISAAARIRRPHSSQPVDGAALGRLSQDDAAASDLRHALSDTRAAVDELQRRAAIFNDDLNRAEERLLAVNALAQEVGARTAALQHQERSIRRAVVNARRTSRIARHLDLQVGRLTEGLKQMARADDAVERIGNIVEDLGEYMEGAVRLNEIVRAETSRLETAATEVLETLRSELDTLSTRRTEVELFVESMEDRLSRLRAAGVGPEAGTAHLRDHHVVYGHEGPDELRIREAASRARRILAAFTGSVASTAESVWSRAQRFLDDRRPAAGLTASAGASAGLAVGVHSLRAVAALVAIALSSGVVIAGLLMTTWLARRQIEARRAAERAPAMARASAPAATRPEAGGAARMMPARAGLTIQRDGRTGRRRILVPVSISPLYSDDDNGVSRPVPVRQELPPWPGARSERFRASALVDNPDLSLPAAAMGVLEVVIGAKGQVESAVMRVSIHPGDDRRVTAAARQWRYRPALKDGKPVRYKKAIRVLFR